MICPGRPSLQRGVALCTTHVARWRGAGRPANQALQEWLSEQTPFPGSGECQVEVCPELALEASMCRCHLQRYRKDRRQGDAWLLKPQPEDPDGPARYAGEAGFIRWCATAAPVYRHGLINLRGLRPLIKAEIQWGLHQHAQIKKRGVWQLSFIQRAADLCRATGMASLAEFAGIGEGYDRRIRLVFAEIADGLRCIYFTPADAKEAGYLETSHFGRRFPRTRSYFSLTDVSQRWLRDLLWDHLAEVLRSPHCPRSRLPFDYTRRAARAERLPGDRRPRRRSRPPGAAGRARAAVRRRPAAPGARRPDIAGRGPRRREAVLHRDVTIQAVFNYGRRLLFWALETGDAGQLGLDRGFITALPHRRPPTPAVPQPLHRRRRPGAGRRGQPPRTGPSHDPNDNGLRDAWETIVFTGRRCSEVLAAGRTASAATAAWRCSGTTRPRSATTTRRSASPNTSTPVLDARQRKTLDLFQQRHGRPPTPGERAADGAVPHDFRNPD